MKKPRTWNAQQLNTILESANKLGRRGLSLRFDRENPNIMPWGIGTAKGEHLRWVSTLAAVETFIDGWDSCNFIKDKP